jgi:hypothetical protein
MITLDYSPLRATRPYRYAPLVIAGICLAITGAFYLCTVYSTPGFPGPPAWILWFEKTSWIIVIVGESAALIAMMLLIFRYQSLAHLIVVVTAAMLCIVGAPFLILSANWELRLTYHHPYYLQVMANGRFLAQSSVVYAFEHNGRFPPHPAVLLLGGEVRSDELACRQFVPFVVPSSASPESDWRLIASDVDARSLFVYTAADLVDDGSPIFPEIILLYSKRCPALPGYRVVLFVDCRSELLRETDLPKEFAVSNAVRARLKLPSFDLDGPPPTPSASAPSEAR